MPLVEAQREASHDAFGFIEALEQLSTVDDVANAFTRAIARYGVQHFIATGLSTKGQPFEELVIAARWPPEFFMLYVENDFARVDPLILRSIRSHMPFEWHADAYRSDADPRVAEIMRRGAEFGLRQGYLVPIHGPKGQEGCVSLAGDRLVLTAQARCAVHLMALYAFDRMRCLRGNLPTAARKLGAANRTQAVAIAMRDRLIEL
jgi:LuxR family quorum sensing-dependent transcriptional regulator